MRWLLVGLVGCSGASETPGEANPADCSRTSAAPASSGLVWVDAAGEDVPGVAQLTALSYIDGTGAVWTLDPWGWSAEQAFGTFGSAVNSQIVFKTDKCDEPWVFAPEPPRLVAEVHQAFDGEPVGYYVTPDDAQPEAMSDPYALQDSACVPFDTPPDQGIPLSKMRKVDLPGLGWTPPLHPEWR